MIHVYPTEQDKKFLFCGKHIDNLFSLVCFFLPTDNYAVETEYNGKSVFFLF